MKPSLVLFLLLLLPVMGMGQAVREIPLTDIEAIATRAAIELWGKVNSDNPIPYYDIDGNLSGWQFNFCLGESFPDREVLKQRCRTEGTGLWAASWNKTQFANMFMGARSDRPVIISYAMGLSYDYSYLAQMERFAAKTIQDPYKLERMVYINHGSRWFVLSDANGEYFHKAYAPHQTLSVQEFRESVSELVKDQRSKDYSSLWAEYLSGRTDRHVYAYIPNHEKMPFYQWFKGCSPTSAAMLAAWWDYNSDAGSSDFANLVKYHYEEWDDIQDHQNYHIPDAIASLASSMGTSESGGTQEWNIDDGIEDFFVNRGYECWTDNDDLCWEFLWDADDLFYAARGQIRGGRPLIFSIPGHSITGMGYSTDSHHLAFHDPNYSTIQTLYQSEFDMLCYVHPSSGFGNAVRITSPTGGQDWLENGTGETWSAGATYQINWEGDLSDATHARLSYHLAGGYEPSGWVLITASTPNDGSYDWNIPAGISSSQCRFKVEILNQSNALMGTDGSVGNFSIVPGGENPILYSGGTQVLERNPSYYRVPDNANSWIVLASQKSSASTALGLQLYPNASFGDPLVSATQNQYVNLIAIDSNHLPDNQYGLKASNLNQVVGGRIELESQNHELEMGMNAGMLWGAYQIAKMWDLYLTPGFYRITLNMESGGHDLGLAFFSSQNGNYIQSGNQAIMNMNNSPAGGDESFLVYISATDNYGLCVYSTNMLSSNSSYSIMIGSPGLWTGAISQYWDMAENWANNQVPNSTNDILIPSNAVRQPRIYAGTNAGCRSLTIQSGASLEIANGSLTVSGGYTNIYGTLKLSSSVAALHLWGHLEWHAGSLFQETGAGTINVGGSWITHPGALVQINICHVHMVGAESASIQTGSDTSWFWNLTLDKDYNRSIVWSEESTAALVIKGNLTVIGGTGFYGWQTYNENMFIDLEGNLVTNGGVDMRKTTLRLIGNSQYIYTNSADRYFGMKITNGSIVDLNANLYLYGSMDVENGLLNAGDRTISVEGGFTCHAAFGHISDTAHRVKMLGSNDVPLCGIGINIVEIAKTGTGQVIVEAGTLADCNSLVWTSGTIKVAGGNLWVDDLADNRIMGSYILESGQIDLHQDASQTVNLDANLKITGGVFNVHSANSAPSMWANTQSIQLEMSGGVLDFADNSILISNNSYYFVSNLRGGTIRTARSFLVERSGFNPLTSNTVELYGSGNAILHVNSPSYLGRLVIDKGTREMGRSNQSERTNQVLIDANTRVQHSCTVLSGALKIDNCTFTSLFDLTIYGSIIMNSAGSVINVGIARWKSGSVANITAGTIRHDNLFMLEAGCSVNLPPAVQFIFSQDTGIQIIDINEPSAVLGTMVCSRPSGTISINLPSDNTLGLSGDLVIKANNTLWVYNDNINVGGKIDIWNGGTFTLKGVSLVNTANLYNSGLLNLEAYSSSELTVASSFLQYSNGELALHGGVLKLNAAYSGLHYSFGGTTNISGGILQITNNGIQIGASGFNFTGGTIKLGWNLIANTAASFQAGNGTVEFIGTSQASINLAGGNYLPDLVINKTGITGSVTINNDVLVKKDCAVLSGRLYMNHHRLTVSRSVVIASSGYLYGLNSDDEIWVGGNWSNYGTPDNFLEGTGLVRFFQTANNKHITTDESFHRLVIDTYSLTQPVSVNEGATINVGSDLEISSGKLQLTSLSHLTVSGNLALQSSEFVMSGTQANLATATVNGGMNIVNGVLSSTYGSLTVHGSFTTSPSSNVYLERSELINDISDGTLWHIVNCPWVMDSFSVATFPSIGFQTIEGGSIQPGGTIKAGRNFAVIHGSGLVNFEGTVEFIGPNQSIVSVGGVNSFGKVVINKDIASVYLSSNVKIKGDLLIQSGVLDSNDFDIEIHGNWHNSVGSGGYLCRTGEVTFKASGGNWNNPFTISGLQTFYKIRIEHPSNSRATGILSMITVLTDVDVLSGGIQDETGYLSVNNNITIASGAFLLVNHWLYFLGNITDNNSSIVNNSSLRAGLIASPSSQLVMEGAGNQTISSQSPSIDLADIWINKQGGSFLPAKPVNAASVVISSGTWGYGSSGMTHSFSADLVIDPGGAWNDATGTVCFTGTGNHIFSVLGAGSFKNITVDKDSSAGRLDLMSDLSLSAFGILKVDGGTFAWQNHTLQASGNVLLNSGAKMLLGESAILKMPNGSSLSVNNGAELSLLGSLTQKAKISSMIGNYGLNVFPGGTIGANYAVFEYMDSDGVNVQNGAFVSETDSFNNTTFQHGQSGGTLLRLNNNQQLNIANAYFPLTLGPSVNVSKIINHGTVTFSGETGDFAGTLHENDPYFRINWSADVPQIQANPGSFSFGDVPWSQTSDPQMMLIHNYGSAMLSGTIIMPANFLVSPYGRDGEDDLTNFSGLKLDNSGSRNIQEFQVGIGGNAYFQIYFQPADPVPYYGEMIITHNAPGASLVRPLYGNGKGARITYDPSSFVVDLAPGQSGQRTLNLGNSGSSSLDYFAYVSTSGRPEVTVLETGFEDSFPPEGWSQTEVIYLSGQHGVWNRATSASHVTGVYPTSGAWLGYFNSYYAASGNSARLESPVINLNNMNSVNLSFWMYHDSSYSSFNDYLQVQVSNNGGAWTNLGSPIFRYSASPQWQQHYLSLWEYQGNENVRIGLLGTSAYGNDILIDDLRVSGSFQPPFDWITLNSENMLWGNIGPGQTDAPICINVNGTGIPSGWYMNQLYISSNDPSNSALMIPITVLIGTADYSLYPDTLDFGSVAAGSDTTLTFTIHNTGQTGLFGTISAPETYHVARLTAPPPGRDTGNPDPSEDSRDAIDYYLWSGEFGTFEVSFSPTQALAYNSQLTISSNTGIDTHVTLLGQGIGLPVVATLAAGQIGVQSATCGGNVVSTGNLPILERGICWYTDPEPTLDHYFATAEGSNGEYEVQMNNLIHMTQYFVRAYATNAMGISYGETISFITLSPWLQISTTALPDFGFVPVAGSSPPQSFTISGGNLVDSVMLFSPNGFQISLSPNDGYGMEIILPQDDYILAETSIYVIFSPMDTGFWESNLVPLTVGGSGASVYLSGSGVTQASVETATVVNITTDSASINCRVTDNGGGPLNACGVCWNTEPQPTISNYFTDEGNQNDWFSSDINGLIPNTQYFVRSYAINPAGLVYGNELSFRSVPEPFICVVDSLLDAFGRIVVGEVSTADTLQISATQLMGDLVITAPYGFELSLSRLGSETREYASQLTLSPVTGNIPLTTVYVRFAPGSGGNLAEELICESAGLQSVNTMLFGIGVTLPTVSTLPASYVTSCSAQAGGVVIANGWDVVSACGICFSTSESPDLSDPHTFAQSNEGEFNAYMEGLLPDTTYYVRAYATNMAGTSYGEQLSFRTELGTLDPPHNLRITLQGTNVSLEWDAVSNAHSYLIFRRVDPCIEDWGLPIAVTADTCWTDSSTGSLYFYRITASSEALE